MNDSIKAVKYDRYESAATNQKRPSLIVEPPPFGTPDGDPLDGGVSPDTTDHLPADSGLFRSNAPVGIPVTTMMPHRSAACFWANPTETGWDSLRIRAVSSHTRRDQAGRALLSRPLRHSTLDIECMFIVVVQTSLAIRILTPPVFRAIVRGPLEREPPENLPPSGRKEGIPDAQSTGRPSHRTPQRGRHREGSGSSPEARRHLPARLHTPAGPQERGTGRLLTARAARVLHPSRPRARCHRGRGVRRCR